MLCAHCKKQIGETETYCKAGPNHTIFCSKNCVHQSLKKFYTKNELNKIIQIVTHS